MPGGREVVCDIIVVVVHDIRKIAQGYATHERALLGSGNRIANSAVPGKVGTENFTRSDTRGWNCKRAGQWTVEVKNRSEAKMRRKVCVATKGKQVSAVEGGGATEAAGVVVVDRRVDEILISGSGRGARGSGQGCAAVRKS